MPKDLLIVSIGMAMFIICPRMVGMVHVIAKHSQVLFHFHAISLYGNYHRYPVVFGNSF